MAIVVAAIGGGAGDACVPAPVAVRIPGRRIPAVGLCCPRRPAVARQRIVFRLAAAVRVLRVPGEEGHPVLLAGEQGAPGRFAGAAVVHRSPGPGAIGRIQRPELGVPAQRPGQLNRSKRGDAAVEGGLPHIGEPPLGVLGDFHHAHTHGGDFGVNLGRGARHRRGAIAMQENRRHPLVVDGEQGPVGGFGRRPAIGGQTEVLHAVVPVAAAAGVVGVVAIVAVIWNIGEQRIANRDQHPRGVTRRHHEVVGE